jgi:hypothetical protein
MSVPVKLILCTVLFTIPSCSCALFLLSHRNYCGLCCLHLHKCGVARICASRMQRKLNLLITSKIIQTFLVVEGTMPGSIVPSRSSSQADIKRQRSSPHNFLSLLFAHTQVHWSCNKHQPLAKSAGLKYLSVSDSRDRTCKTGPSPSLRSLLTHTHWSIGYRNKPGQLLARLKYLSVSDIRDRSWKTAPSPSLRSLLTNAHRSIG